MRYLLTVILSLVLVSPGFCDQLNLVVVFDGSGSMASRFSKSNDRGTKMDAAKKALVQILNQLPTNTNLGIVVFSSSHNGWLVKLGPIDKTNLTNQINSVNEGGGTPLGKYMKDGANALLELRAKQKSGVYKLLVVTDGESSDDAETPLTGKYGILSKGLRVEAIGVDMSSKHSLATKVPYRSAENAEQLTTAVKAVLAESTGKNDHSEDYDLIAPIPPEVAMAALVALSEVDNEPVGQPPKSGISSGSDASGGVGTALFVVAIVLGVVAVIVVVAAIICNKR
jgi:hypothetical protein